LSILALYNSQAYGYGKTNADLSGANQFGFTWTSTGNVFSGRVNGSSDIGTVSSAGGWTTTFAPADFSAIGARHDGSLPFPGRIAEIIVMTTLPTSDDIEKIEGYLAHKWGTTGALPAGHPYKSVAPSYPGGSSPINGQSLIRPAGSAQQQLLIQGATT
jgi:hypothetical protein